MMSTQAIEKLPPLHSSNSLIKIREGSEARSRQNRKKNDASGLAKASRLQDHCSSLNSAGWSVIDERSCLMNVERNDKMNSGLGTVRFIIELERYLERELRELGDRAAEPSIVRLQVYREVFEQLISGFKIYRPLLASIKNEYELVIEQLRHRIHTLEPLQQMLISVSEECEERIVKFREREREELEEMKAERRQLMERVSELIGEREEMAAQVDRFKKELSSEYLRYRDEADARKLLICEINDLHYQQEEDRITKQNMEQAQASGNIKDDPIVLKLALKKARENEKSSAERLNEMIANYSDVIPRRQYEQLQKDFNVSEEKEKGYKNELKRVTKEHSVLLDVHKEVVSQRDKYYLECEAMKRSATPRPDWGKCADHIIGGEERWQKLSEGRSSRELVEVLLKELESRESGFIDDDDAMFDGLGFDASVPKYLQYEGKVYNRHMTKRDCALLVHDIWTEKIKADSSKGAEGKRSNLADYVSSYLEAKYSAVREMKVEWAYNLRDAVQRYSADDYIGLFFAILIGEADEEIYYTQLDEILALQRLLADIDVETGSSGGLSQSHFASALSQFYPTKNSESITALLTAAVDELKIKDDLETLQYKRLFRQDRTGHYGSFVEEFKRQLMQEKLDFIEEITQQLSGKQLVSVDDLRKAISSVDSDVSDADLSRYIAWVYSLPTPTIGKEPETAAKPLDLGIVVSKLQYGNIMKTKNKT